jgi:hypothetical protein
MSKKSKAKAKLKRLNQKRGRKAARQAQYEAYAKAGQNKKSKRFRKGSKVNSVRTTKHATAFCGNLACAKCFPQFNNPLTAPKHSCLWMKQFTSSKYAD